MTTTEQTDQEVRRKLNPQDQAGDLAESARRHIAYERLARQIATSEAAAKLVLDALARHGQKGVGEAATEESHERNERG